MKRVRINLIEERFILRAILNQDTLMDFSIDNKEFIESYEITKKQMKRVLKKLKEKLE